MLEKKLNLYTTELKVWIANRKRNPWLDFRLKVHFNYKYHCTFSNLSELVNKNFFLFNLIWTTPQLLFAANNFNGICLVTCSTGSIISYNLKKLESKNESGFKRLKKLKNSWQIFIRASLQLINVVGASKMHNCLVFRGVSRFFLDFFLTYEYIFFKPFFQFVWFKLNKTFGLCNVRKKKAIKRRIFFKLNNSDRLSYNSIKTKIAL